jgi:hypothetical protein
MKNLLVALLLSLLPLIIKAQEFEDTVSVRLRITIASDSIVCDSVQVQAIFFQRADKGLLLYDSIYLKTCKTFNRYNVNGKIYTCWNTFNKMSFVNPQGYEIKDDRIFMFKYRGHWQTPDE